MDFSGLTWLTSRSLVLNAFSMPGTCFVSFTPLKILWGIERPSDLVSTKVGISIPVFRLQSWPSSNWWAGPQESPPQRRWEQRVPWTAADSQEAWITGSQVQKLIPCHVRRKPIADAMSKTKARVPWYKPFHPAMGFGDVCALGMKQMLLCHQEEAVLKITSNMLGPPKPLGLSGSDLMVFQTSGNVQGV